MPIYSNVVRDEIRYDLLALSKAQELVAQWESDPTCAAYIERKIERALAEKAPAAKKVNITLAGIHGPVTTTIPTQVFHQEVAKLGTVCLFTISPERERKRVAEEMVASYAAPLNLIEEIRYRGKTIYQKG